MGHTAGYLAGGPGAERPQRATQIIDQRLCLDG